MHAEVHDFLNRGYFNSIRIAIVGSVYGIIEAQCPRLIFLCPEDEIKQPILILGVSAVIGILSASNDSIELLKAENRHVHKDRNRTLPVSFPLFRLVQIVIVSPVWM